MTQHEAQMRCLNSYGISDSAASHLFAGGYCFEKMGGVPLDSYWLTEEMDNRDEYFLIANTSISLYFLAQQLKPINDWRLKFDIAYFFNMKSNMQTIVSIDKLVNASCYMDSMALCRLLQSRMNLLLLCSLNPSLFDKWLKNPKLEIFFDGHIRKELENNNIGTLGHVYEFGSEIVHGHFLGLGETGYFEQGAFANIPSVRNRVYVAGKFILGVISYTMLSMLAADYGFERLPEEIKQMEKLFDLYIDNTLDANRLDHLFTLIAEERYWEKIGKDKYNIGGGFDFKSYRDQVHKFHRKTGQRKQLSKKYNT